MGDSSNERLPRGLHRYKDDRESFFSSRDVPLALYRIGAFKNPDTGKSRRQLFKHHGRVGLRNAIHENTICMGEWEKQIREARDGGPRHETYKNIVINPLDNTALKLAGQGTTPDKREDLQKLLLSVLGQVETVQGEQRTADVSAVEQLAKALQSIIGKAEAEPTVEHVSEQIEVPAIAQPAIRILAGGDVPIISDELIAWLELFRKKNAKDASLKENSIRQFVDWLKANDIRPHFSDITRPIALSYFKHQIAENGFKYETCRKHQSGLRAFWAYMRDERNLINFEESPWDKLLGMHSIRSALEESGGSAKESGRDPFTNAQLSLLFSKCPNQEMLDVMSLMVGTALRPAELFGLTIEDCEGDVFRIRRGEIAMVDGTMRPRTIKTDTSVRMVPVPTHLIPTVRRLCGKRKGHERLLVSGYADGIHPLGQRFSNDVFRPFLKELGIYTEKLSLYSFRHSCLILLEDAEVSKENRDLISGHKGQGQDAHYVKGRWRDKQVEDVKRRLLKHLDLLPSVFPPEVLTALDIKAPKKKAA